MKKKTHLIVFSLALAALALLFTLVARTGYGQSQLKEQPGATTVGGLQPTAATRERRVEVPAESAGASLFTAAAARNTLLRYELSWAFGGKTQRGWYLYTPLISRLLATDGDAATGDFASALSRWQKTTGLEPNGVLDDETLLRMVTEWQGARLKNKEYARPDELLVAPTSDFYDASRPDELRQVERETYAAYRRMVAAAAADPTLGLKRTASGELAPDERFFKIVSAFRSREYQENLRRQSPNSGRAGLAVNSPHFTGRALDLYVGGEPVETKDVNRALQVQTAAYRWLVRNADRFGFRPYYYEPWHWEYVGGGTLVNK
ncbi:MAG: zinc D-Ala-D-Ala carboxypeptidase [Acidobacteriota bacterium]|jgi:LAS superfamily LD-carboxypeptidase LdcB|nr:zinc D-Ala-D-Ala carboxypeptidase [Acidobacteriota bacterium]